MVSKGKLPEDFVKSASTKASEEIEKLKKHKDKKAKEKMGFLISNAFFIDNLLKSGKVLYGDPISEYVAKVANELHILDDKGKHHVRVYTVKSTVVNAYAFDNGAIFVTTGLISQLENEAQLAFVLCHELVHIKKKHSINAHIEFLSIENKKKSYNKNGTNILLQKSKFNKEQESEADREGFKVFEKSNYDYASIDGLFDVLQYSYLPFDEIEFDKSYFNDEFLKIPSSYYKEKTREIESTDETNDSLSSHPNIKKRREFIESELSGKDNKGRKDFIVSKEEFEKARDLARFETCRMYMQDIEYPDAIYAAYILSKKYPENIYLKKTIARATYELSVYKSLYERYDYVYFYNTNSYSYKKVKKKSYIDRLLLNADSVQGASQQVYALFKKMSGLETTVLALKKNWLINQELKYNDKCTSDICDSLISILKSKYKLKLDDFSKTAKVPVPDSTLLSSSVKQESKTGNSKKKEESKYDKIRKKKATQGMGEDGFIKYALVDIVNDAKLISAFKATAHKEEKEKPKKASKTTPVKKNEKTTKDTDESETSEPSDSTLVSANEYKDIALQSALVLKEASKLKKLGLDRILVVDPQFVKIDERKKQSTQYFAAEKGLAKLTAVIEKTADAYGVKCDILNPDDFSDNEVEKYNDLTMINEWVSERVNHGDFSSPLILNNEIKNKIKSKYQTTHILFTGVVVTTEPSAFRQMPLLVIFLSLYSYPVLPLYFNWAYLPQHETNLFSLVLDIETGRVELYKEQMAPMKAKNDALTVLLSNTMYQIKTEKQK